MGLFEHFPYTNFHELNLDWLLNKVKDLANRMDNFEIQNPQLEQRTPCYVLIGDSYAIDYPGVWEGWASQFANIINVMCVAKCKGGAGFTNASEGDNFQTLLQAAINDIDNDRIHVTDIIVAGGYNDMASNADDQTITTAIQNFVNAARNAWPGVGIHLGFLGIDYRTGNYMTKLRHTKKVYEDACVTAKINNIANAWNILKNKSLLLNIPGNPNNYYHPSTAGNFEIAKKFKEYITNGWFDVVYHENCTSYEVSTHNGVAVINSTAGYGISVPGGTYVFNTEYTVQGLETTSNLLWGTDSMDTAFHAQLPLWDNNGGSAPLGWMDVYLINRKICFKNLYNTSNIVVPEGGGYVGGFNFVIPDECNY